MSLCIISPSIKYVIHPDPRILGLRIYTPQQTQMIVLDEIYLLQEGPTQLRNGQKRVLSHFCGRVLLVRPLTLSVTNAVIATRSQ
jgi:hypothetical protein